MAAASGAGTSSLWLLTFNPGRTPTVAGMDGYSISQVAQRTGFPASTLRFYEKSGLVRPERTPAGYRSYDDRHIELLAFIGRAKGFGLSLDEITELLALLDDERCAPVQGRLRDLVGTKIAEAQDKVAELEAFAAELRRVAVTLGDRTPDGPCDDTCGCTTDPDSSRVDVIELDAKPTRSAAPAIACNLAADRVGDQLAAWQTTIGRAVAREPIPGGIRLRFGRDIDIAELSALMAAEQACCGFFTFALTVDVDEVTLEMTGPPDAQPIVDALVGTAQ